MRLIVKDTYDASFLVLLFVGVILRAIWLEKPGTLMFDEVWYVWAARAILGVASPALLNLVHPPLAKLIIALSMHVLGDNSYAWRIPSVIFGSLAILIFYLLLKKIASKRTALIASFLLSFDNLAFAHSRIAMLDIFTLTFMLLGFYWYFSGHPSLSALGMALSTLTKLTGAFGFIVIVVFEATRFATNRRTRAANELRWLSKYVVVYVFSFLLMLTVLDYFWGGQLDAYSHIRYMVLRLSAIRMSYCGRETLWSCPWQWLINQNPIRYSAAIQLWGAMNPAIVYLAIPAMVYSGYSYLRSKNEFALFNIVWFAVTYLPYYPLVMLWHRQTYLFYFLLTLPSVCAAIAFMFVNLRGSRLLIPIYLAIVLLLFYSMFPFRS